MSFLNRSKKLILATTAILVLSVTLLFSVTSIAQNFVGSGVDMRGLNTHSCKAPALALQTRLMQLKQEMLQIIECNRNGGLFQGSACVDGAAVVTDHFFMPNQGGAPDNRDGLSFNGGAYGLIGGAEGASINCVLASPDCSYDGNTIADGDTMTLYEVAPTCGDPCGLVGSYTCNSGTFTPSPPAPSSDIYTDAALCPYGPCAGCVDPCTGNSLDDGLRATVYNPVRACGDGCMSESIICNDGVLDDPSWGVNTQCSCPDEPLTCDDCPHPITGTMVTEGDSITLYEEDAACGSCSSDTFTCTAGSFGDTTGFVHEDSASCLTANACPPGCRVFVGGVYQETISDGESTTYYRPSTTLATCDTCADVRTQTCSGGTDITYSSSYSTSISSLSACEAANPCPNSCSINWADAGVETIAHGDSVTANQTGSVPFGSSCTTQTRTCNNGSLSGSYTYQNCAPETPVTCSYNGTNYNEGQQITLYKEKSIACGECFNRTYTCGSDGSFDIDVGYDYSDEGVCEAANACQNCTSSLTGNMTHNTDVTLYSKASAACGTCNSRTFSCDDGTISPMTSMNSSYTYSSENSCIQSNACIVTCPAVASTSWSAGCMGSLSETTAGSSDTINDSAGDYTGSATYPCRNDGTWDSPTNTSCEGPSDCTYNGSDVPHGQSRDFWSDATPSCGSSCDKQSRTCNDGSWGSPTTYTATSCTEPTGCIDTCNAQALSWPGTTSGGTSCHCRAFVQETNVGTTLDRVLDTDGTDACSGEATFECVYNATGTDQVFELRGIISCGSGVAAQ